MNPVQYSLTLFLPVASSDVSDSEVDLLESNCKEILIGILGERLNNDSEANNKITFYS